MRNEITVYINEDYEVFTKAQAMARAKELIQDDGWAGDRNQFYKWMNDTYSAAEIYDMTDAERERLEEEYIERYLDDEYRVDTLAFTESDLNP